jgi:hypothetical protein
VFSKDAQPEQVTMSAQDAESMQPEAEAPDGDRVRKDEKSRKSLEDARENEEIEHDG